MFRLCHNTDTFGNWVAERFTTVFAKLWQSLHIPACKPLSFQMHHLGLQLNCKPLTAQADPQIQMKKTGSYDQEYAMGVLPAFSAIDITITMVHWVSDSDDRVWTCTFLHDYCPNIQCLQTPCKPLCGMTKHWQHWWYQERLNALSFAMDNCVPKNYCNSTWGCSITLCRLLDSFSREHYRSLSQHCITDYTEKKHCKSKMQGSWSEFQSEAAA